MMTGLGKGLASTMALALMCGALGCELIAAVDRDKIMDGGGTGGGAAECAAPEDCPAPSSECVARTCTDGKCGTSMVAAGTPLGTQVAGDCKVEQCDGAGM